MNHQPNVNSSALTKLRQAYWEAKRNLNNSLGTQDDDCWTSNDSDLDKRIELLQEADICCNRLLKYLLQYKRALCTIMTAEENLGLILVEYGTKDTTHAAKLMVISGRAITESAKQRAPLKSQVVEVYHEVQTFHLKATADVLQTVTKMEKVRKSYRSGLLWMKNESRNLDPDVNKKLNKFRKVQEHIKHLNMRFDAAKLESMQKIDLYLLSRCNLFSKSLVPYREVFCKMNMNYATLTKSAVQNIPSSSSYKYKFETLKELNEYSTRQKMESSHQSSKLRNRSKGLYKRNPNSKGELKSTTKAAKSQSTSCVQVKKVTFKDPLEYGPTNENSSTTSETLLIDLNDEENQLVQNKAPVKDSNFIPGKYSEDLLSIQLDSNVFGDTVKKSDEHTKLEDEFEKCFGFLDKVIAQPPNEKSSELHFWSLIENFADLKEPCEKVLSRCKSPINPTENQQRDSVSHWENVLIEFDPYNESISRFVKESTYREDC